MRQIELYILLSFLIGLSWAKIFSRCELAQKLDRQGLSRSDLPDWVCLIESESSRNTKAIHVNKGGSIDYGLFQINNKWWCSEGSTPGKDCHVTCKDLLSDDITKSVECAKKIKKRQGYHAWHGWELKCKGKPLPDLKPCF